MNIKLNGEIYNINKENITVVELLEELSIKWKIDLSGAVVLVNDNVIKKTSWNDEKIANDYVVEVLSFVSGG
ncbi:MULTISPECIES: sulfur carrier protein ThiS [Fusobacterium]|jgi:sulfur carrier protein|uniref:Sulfur carrier protein ThiS n=1 Tax=Fusobacterium hominis TaxID=2764326 RepID=A0A7G9GYL3_9FUSO|nr:MULTISPECIES: sulfur carrier protein ThiS [Fusobacterium]QNM15895.1 sulfur carrier protein ThiS [Fusobacterium hominis]